MSDISFDTWAGIVNKLGWGDVPPDQVPRYVFALYVAGYHSGMSPEQFQAFMSARAFVNTTTAPLKSDKVSLKRADDFLHEWKLRTDVKVAVPKLLERDEVDEKYFYLFGDVPKDTS